MVLRVEFTLNCKIKNCLPNIVGRNSSHFIKNSPEIIQTRRFHKSSMTGARKHGETPFPFLLLRFQLVAQRHQLIDFGDDAFLFCRGR